jgi:Uma2 family endonuclease
MGMPAHQTEWTAEMVRALPEDGKKYEVLDGELFVSPAPRPDHQAVVVRLAVILDAYVREHELGWVFTSPADVEFSPRRQVQPDVFVVADTGKGRPRSWREARPLTLVAEVKSESTARADRISKRSIYQSERIPVYWIVDPDARLVECWTPEDKRPAVIAAILTWRPEEDIPPLEINLPEFFAASLD